MLTTYTLFLSDVLTTPLGQIALVGALFLAGIGTSLVPETVATILPRLVGHVYKRMYYAIGMVASVICVGVLGSWILGPYTIGRWSYIIWSLLLIIVSLQSLELVAFIHPVPFSSREDRRLARKATTWQRSLYIVWRGIKSGLSWRYDRLPIYIWLVATIAVAGWRLASFLIISFIIGYLIPVFWLTGRLERLGRVVIQPNYRVRVLWFKRIMGVVMILEALFFFGMFQIN